MRATAISPDRYGAIAIAFHWAIALLILVNWPLSYFSEGIERSLGQSRVALHKSIGLTVLGLSVLRFSRSPLAGATGCRDDAYLRTTAMGGKRISAFAG